MNTLTDEDIELERVYILTDYGLQAFLDLTASTSDYPKAKNMLGKMLKTCERLERYEDCAFIVNVVPLLN
jgi:hypothetical protein